MPGWKPACGPAYLPFPDFPAKADTNITPYRNRGASTRQVPATEARKFGQNLLIRQGAVCWLLLSLSILLSYQVSVQHGILILQTFTYLNINQPLA